MIQGTKLCIEKNLYKFHKNMFMERREKIIFLYNKIHIISEKLIFTD